jgi:hypothetical protein
VLVFQLIRIVYGASLNPGTFEEALTEFQTAVALNPNKLIHRYARKGISDTPLSAGYTAMRITVGAWCHDSWLPALLRLRRSL